MKDKRFQKIYVEITNTCNLKCSFCLEGKREKRFMSVDEFKKVILKIQDYTNLITLHVKGEPLLHPNLKELLEVCRDANIMVNITTNATLLEKRLETILDSKAVRQINLSLHSINKNENTKLYNFDTYLDEVIKTSKIILEKSNIIISYRLWNLESLEQNDENSRILEKLENEFRVENLKERAKKESFVKLDKNAFLNQDFEFVWPSIENEIISEVGTCQGLRSQIAILSNGDIVPCCLDQDAEIKLGNIFEENLNDILEKKLTNEIIKGFENHKVIHNLCKRCGFRCKFDK